MAGRSEGEAMRPGQGKWLTQHAHTEHRMRTPVRSRLVMPMLNYFQYVLHCAMRVRLSAVLVALAWMLNATHSPGATISWSGTGGNDLWSNPLNWTGGALPTVGDDVVINVPEDVTVRMDSPNTSVRSLQCQESFLLEYGPFTVTAGTSVINGAFNMNPNQTLVADGATTVFTVNGAVTNLAALQATSGGVLAFPSARQLSVDAVSAWNGRLWLYAYGEGSAILLTNLTNVVIVPGYFLLLDTYLGSRIDVQRLRVPEGSIRVSAQNTNSLIDLSGFSGLWTPGFSGGYSSSLSANDGGTVLIPNVTALEQVDLYISGSANVNIAQLHSITGGTLTLASRTNGFNGLTNFSGSLSAYDSRLDWTNFTVLYLTNSHPYSIGADQGSLIDLSQVTNVFMNLAYGLNLRASSGSRIDLRGLRQPDGDLYIYVSAHNAGSVVDLSGLAGLWEGNNSSVRADDGGTVLIPNVTAMDKVSLTVSRSSIVPTEQLRSCTEVTFTLYGRTNSLAGLTNFTGYLIVYDTRLDLTNFTVLYATNSTVFFQANQSSFIDLSGVTNVVGNSGLTAYAFGGSRIDLRRLHVPEGPVNAGAYDAGSVVDLSGFTGLWRGGGGVTAETGGTVLMPNVTALDGVSLSVNADANVDLAQLTSITAGSVTLRKRTNDLTGLTNFTGRLTANDSRLELTNLTVLYVTNHHVYIQADEGSQIDLSQVTNAVMTGWTLSLYAYNGSRIDLSRLPVPQGGPIYTDARGLDSLVDFSGFTGLWHANDSVSLVASSGGTVAIPNVTETRGVSFFLNDNANVPLAQLRSFSEGYIRLIMQTNVFAGLTNFTGTMDCNSQSRAEFPGLTQLNATNYSVAFLAQSGGVVDLSRVTNAVAKPHSLSLSASYGGRIEIPNLETIVAGQVDVRADGTDAVVDLSSLTGFFSDNNSSSLRTTSGGVILLNSDAILLAGVAIDFQTDPGGVLPPFLAPSESLVLYGQPWQSYRIESRDPSVAGTPWSLYRRMPLTSPLEIVSARPPKGLALRVRTFVADPSEVDIRIPAPGMTETVIFGVPGRTYRLETTTSLSIGIWENGPTRTMTNSFFIFPSAGTTNDARFYRARQL